MATDSEDHSCCAPESPQRTPPERLITRGSADASSTMVLLPGATFTMGSDDDEGEPGDGEAPARPVTLSPFWIDTLAVSNGRFAEFVAETGYVSEAESAGTSFVFAGLLPDDAPPTRAIADAPWWREVSGADWRHPEGPGSSLDQREDHPVVHVSWHDASAYCAWAGVRLPTEAEWEYAARGGLNGARFPWGDDLTPGGVHCCNIWQGRFPILNSGDDGYYGTAPVTTFEPNAFGLYNMSGNAWEWCADWFTPYHSHEHLNDPRGPGLGTHRVIRGGSYLCHESYCNRYRVSARSSNTPSSTTGNMGFRCARDA